MPRNGRTPKSPAFQLYPGDFLADPRVQAMRKEEVGVYCLLLFAEWLEGGPLIDDHEYLARIARCTPEEFATIWVAVGRCFRASSTHAGCIESPRLERERRFQAEGRERRIQASRIAVDARSGNESSTNRARTVHQPSNESSPPLIPTPVARTPTPDSRSPTIQKNPPTPRRRGEPAEPAWGEALRSEIPEPEQDAWASVCLAWEGWRKKHKHHPLPPDAWTELVRHWKPEGVKAFAEAVAWSGAQGWKSVNARRVSEKPKKVSPPRMETAAERETFAAWQKAHMVQTSKGLAFDGATYPGHKAARAELDRLSVR